MTTPTTYTKEMTEDKSAQFHRIGAGFCGSVWARGSDTSAFKREDGGPERSLKNDFDMHQKVLSSFQLHTAQAIKTKNLTIQIPKCCRFIPPTDTEWWNENLPSFPKGHSPCNTIQSQRIPPFPETVRAFLVEKYCPLELRGHIMSSDTNKDCLIRPYLGRRRTQQARPPKFKAFSLRNYPLHIDQIEEIGISSGDMQQYARSMAEALAIMHWIGEIDGNDVEFVLAPPDPQAKGTTSNSLGEHSVWMLDFDLCRMMTMDEWGVKQAVIAFWRNDPFYPRPESSHFLWKTFCDHYLLVSKDCIFGQKYKDHEKMLGLSRLFIYMLNMKA